MGFPLMRKLMTLNGVMAIILHYSAKFSSHGTV